MAVDNIQAWEKLHENPRYWPEYPSERVVQWALTAFPEWSDTTRVLDHGCGTGRHSIFLKEEGFNAEGCDVSEHGLAVASQRAIGKGLNIEFKHYTGLQLPYMDNTFDGLLSYGVLYYLKQEQLGVAIDEMKRVLKPGGKALVVVRSSQDSRAKVKVGRGDDDMEQVFFSPKDCQYLFRGFDSIMIGRQTQIYKTFTDDDLVIYLCK